MLLWEECIADHFGRPTYLYSQLCERYRRYLWRKKEGRKKGRQLGAP